MDWHSRRISAILEHALLEDKATSDATSRACIDPQQRATATILARQDCILAGVGAISRIFEIYERLIASAPRVLRPHGQLILELGYNSSDRVRELLGRDFENIQLTSDLAGIPRVASCQLLH